MKYTILALLISLYMSCETTSKDSFNINANAPGIHNGIRAYLKTNDEAGRLINKDTAIVIEEQFSFKGQRNEPSLEFLFIDGIKGNLPFIVENGNINIEIKKDSLFASKITGAINSEKLSTFIANQIKLSKKKKELMTALRSIAAQPENAETYKNTVEELKSLNENIADLHFDFVEKNKDLYVSAIILENKVFDIQTPLDKIESSYNTLADHLKISSYGKRIKDFIAERKILLEQESKLLQIGDAAPNFSGGTPEGKTLALNDIKGKVTIIDFWASWCGPCRRENPNVVKMYNKYHDKGLEIIGVSLDREGQKDRWTKAIADDELSWHHVSNLKFWQDPIARLYNVSSIPATFILNQKGEIIAQNLRGQELEDKVAELLN